MELTANPTLEITELNNSTHLLIQPGRSLFGAISSNGLHGIPGDKSISHRAALFSALAEGISRIENFQVSGVTRPMLDALTAVGVDWDLDGTHLTVEGKGLLQGDRPPQPINCGNSATTLRLLAGGLASLGVEAILDGSVGLRRRPMQRIVEPMKQMGVSIQATDGCAPLTLHACSYPLHGIAHSLQVASAQVKSCLLLAGLIADSPTIIYEPGPSRDHTERMLSSMGVDLSVSRMIGNEGYGYSTCIKTSPDKTLKPLHMNLPGDFSAAAFLIVSACITPGSAITLQGVGLNPTRTGLLDVLRNMGAKITISDLSEQGGEPVGTLNVSTSELEGCLVEGELVVRMIDEFPIFAIAAAFASGKTEVRDASELRHKESDRITALCQELRKIGVKVEEKSDGFVISGGRPVGGSVQAHGDHRLAMSLAVAGLASEGVIMINHPGIIAESFPGFVHILKFLGGDLVLL